MLLSNATRCKLARFAAVGSCCLFEWTKRPLTKRPRLIWRGQVAHTFHKQQWPSCWQGNGNKWSCLLAQLANLSPPPSREKRPLIAPPKVIDQWFFATTSSHTTTTTSRKSHLSAATNRLGTDYWSTTPRCVVSWRSSNKIAKELVAQKANELCMNLSRINDKKCHWCMKQSVIVSKLSIERN